MLCVVVQVSQSKGCFGGPQARRYIHKAVHHKAVHTKGGLWLPQESCSLRGMQGLAPALSEASCLSSGASQSKGRFGGSKARRAGRGKLRCPTYPSGGGGGGKHTFGVGVRVGVKSWVLIRGGYRNRLTFRLADSAGRPVDLKYGRTFWAKNCALPDET